MGHRTSLRVRKWGIERTTPPPMVAAGTKAVQEKMEKHAQDAGTRAHQVREPPRPPHDGAVPTQGCRGRGREANGKTISP